MPNYWMDYALGFATTGNTKRKVGSSRFTVYFDDCLV